MKLPQSIFETLPQALLNIFSEGRPVDKVVEFHSRLHKKWGSRDRRFFAETCFEIVRHYRQFWVRCGHPRELYLSPEQVTASRMEKILGLYFQDRHPTLSFPPPWRAEERARPETFAERESYSEYFDQLGRQELGARWESVAIAMNHKAPVYLRANFLKVETAELQNRLREEGVLTERIPGLDGGLKLVERKNVFVTQAYQKGLFEVQDLSSQKVVPLLDPQPGERIVDACAGAGGKTLHMASLMHNRGKIIAMDVQVKKLEELRKRANRNGAMLIETRLLENQKVLKRLERTADALLLDVPCSGSGVIRRHPDTKWRFQEADWDRLRQTQQEILQTAPGVVKPGGRMVYATCSVFPSENEQALSTFLKNHPEWQLTLQKTFYPDQDEGDGFFMALLSRT
ncbi:MAG: RsmB/NOP family class I SAM-dependent RNA methyltransferase [Bdellovibrionales bacterium]